MMSSCSKQRLVYVRIYIIYNCLILSFGFGEELVLLRAVFRECYKINYCIPIKTQNSWKLFTVNVKDMSEKSIIYFYEDYFDVSNVLAININMIISVEVMLLVWVNLFNFSRLMSLCFRFPVMWMATWNTFYLVSYTRKKPTTPIVDSTSARTQELDEKLKERCCE